MDVDFGKSGRQAGCERGQARGGHPAGPGKTEHVIRRPHPGPPDLPAEKPGPGRERAGFEGNPLTAGSEHGRGLARNPDRREAEAPADLDHEPPDGRVKVHVLVRIGMLEEKTRCCEGGELGADFARELTAERGAEEIADAEPRLIGGKPAVPIDEIGDFRAPEHGRALDKNEVQADAEAR